MRRFSRFSFPFSNQGLARILFVERSGTECAEEAPACLHLKVRSRQGFQLIRLNTLGRDKGLLR
jgi:hypothetical protein